MGNGYGKAMEQRNRPPPTPVDYISSPPINNNSKVHVVSDSKEWEKA